MEVAAGDALAAEVEFAGCAEGDSLLVLVQDVDLRVSNRTSDGHDGFFDVRVAAVYGAPDGGLGGAVFVEKRDVREVCAVQLYQIPRAGFPGYDGGAKRGKALGIVFLDQQPVERGNAQHMRDLMLFDKPGETLRIRSAVLSRDDERSALAERPENTGDGTVKGERRQEQVAGYGLFIVTETRARRVDRVTVCHADAFGLSGRSACVNHVRQTARRS